MEEQIVVGRYVRNNATGRFGIVKKIMPDKRYIKVHVVPSLWDIWAIDEVELINDARE